MTAIKRTILLLLTVALMLFPSCTSVSNPTDLDTERYIIAYGNGQDQTSAIKDANSNLASTFGFSISTTMTSSEVATNTSSSSKYESVSEQSAAFSDIWGVTTKSVTREKDGYTAVVAIDREQSIRHYEDEMKHLDSEIATLESELLSRGRISFADLNLVNSIMEKTTEYNAMAGICTVLSGKNYPNRDISRIKNMAAELRSSASFSVDIAGDDTGIVKSTLEDMLAENGCRITSKRNATVSIKGDVRLNNRRGSGNNFIFVDYIGNFEIQDNTTSSPITSFTVSGKKGHVRLDSAMNLAAEELSEAAVDNLNAII